MLLILLQLALAVSAFPESPVSAVDPDATRTFAEMCTAYGYQFQSYTVTTADGYILTLYRIPAKTGQPITPGKKVVFMQHGLFDLADTWIMDQPAPGFQFADAGFDVWFGNSRGSFHSLGHVKYNSKTDPQYWQFTWQHMADYDIPAVIPFVLKTTGKAKLTYVGHSQGTLQMFAHLSTDPSFINNINIFIALAPIGTVRHLTIDFFNVIKSIPIMEDLENKGIYEFLPNKNDNLAFYDVCYTFGSACDAIVGFFADQKVSMDNEKRFPVILAHEPGGTSTLNVEHWQQMTNYNTYKVQKFDYGTTGNMANYGTATPPIYDMTKVPGNIAMFSGSADRLGDPTDVDWLESVIPSKSMVYEIEEKNFGHLTFVWGLGMTYVQTLINLANQYQDVHTLENIE